MMTKPTVTAFILATLLASSAALAQEPPPPQPAPTPQPQQPAPVPAPVPAEPQVTPPPPPPEPLPQPQPPPQPTVLSRAAGGAYDRRDSFPSVNVYLPEGQASIRLRKLIRNVLFESQVDYKFVSGDISTYLRYKYYARQFTYKLGVFDTIEFGDIGQQSAEDFQRVRGGLLLLTFPRDYHHRYFALLQNDRLTFGEIDRVDNRKNNIYTKFGVQWGTEFDERLNAIVGESRGRIVPVLTAFRELGPQKFSLAAAVTESAKVATGDYNYTKFESEAIKRWDISPTSFVVTRAHLGTFLTRGTRDASAELIERYAIPRYELFRLGGREALRSVSTAEDLGIGTNELHMTNEYFVPIFRNRNYRTWRLNWNTLYGIGYVGAGNVGFEFRDMVRTKDFVVDAGLGGETSVGIRDFNVLLSVLYARTIRGTDGVKGSKVRFSIRTVR